MISFKRQIRETLLSETQRAVGLPHDLGLENFQADNALIQRAREIYKQYGKKDPSGKDPYNPTYNEYNLPPDGDMIYKILRSRYIQLGQLQNPTVRGSSTISRRIARHRQDRLYYALELFGGVRPNFKYYVHGGPYSSDKKAGEYDSNWLIQYQEILSGGGPDHITAINEDQENGKITESKLRSIIRESILSETQKPLGLPHKFNNFELAKRIFIAIQEDAPDETILGLRKRALNRIKLVRRDIGQGIDVEDNTHQDFVLQQAVDEIDKHLGLYDTSVNRSSFDPVTKSEMGIPDEGPYAGYALKRRAQQRFRQGQEDVFRDAAKQRALRKAGKPYLPYRTDRFLDQDLYDY